MSSKAVRVTLSELSQQKPADIENQVLVEATGDVSREELLAALETAIAETYEGMYAPVDGGFMLATHWEPPYKMVKALATNNPSARVVVKSDAFLKEYWVARAVYEGGKQISEDVLTMNDGEAFETLFKEIHGQSHAEWKKENKQGKVRGGFSWGTADHFDAAKSELGKAEGQI
ncbi:MAG: hypothetical protein LBV12_05035 [Puniceicoccales bacterium]|jgi:hypothetical protein|nr:hypothetical protein [Puniceicoccales bacterium]